jgi:hypothetical protein
MSREQVDHFLACTAQQQHRGIGGSDPTTPQIEELVFLEL